MAHRNLMGKTILGYTVNEMLGSGTFGTVYKVIKKDVSGEYVRALKHITIPNEKQYDSILNSMGGDVSKADGYFLGMLKDIVSEIRILNDLSEKGVQNIVRYYEHSIEESGSPKRYDIYILMEYLTPLTDFIKKEEFTVRDVVNLGTDILYALHLCHANGVMHRDVKDDNLFISSKGEYKIGNFGVSKVLKDSSKAESMKGTPNFLAPEVYLGKESYTKSVDLYSLGIVLYRLLNYNRNPFLPQYPNMFHTADEDRAFERRMKEDTPDLPLFGGEFIGTVIVKSISKSSERYQTAKEFMDALQEALNRTSEEILNKSIKISIIVSTQTDEKQERKIYQSTIGEIVPNIYMEETIGDTYSSSINKHLFETVGEVGFESCGQLSIVSSACVQHTKEENSEVDISKGTRLGTRDVILENKSSTKKRDNKRTVNSTEKNTVDNRRSVEDVNDSKKSGFENIHVTDEIIPVGDTSAPGLFKRKKSIVLAKNLLDLKEMSRWDYKNPIELPNARFEKYYFDLMARGYIRNVEYYLVTQPDAVRGRERLFIFKNPSGTANPPIFIPEGKQVNKLYNGFKKIFGARFNFEE